jgi:hypothetical protein
MSLETTGVVDKVQSILFKIYKITIKPKNPLCRNDLFILCKNILKYNLLES